MDVEIESSYYQCSYNSFRFSAMLEKASCQDKTYFTRGLKLKNKTRTMAAR